MQRPHQGGAGRLGLGVQRLGLTSWEVGMCTAMMGQGGRWHTVRGGSLGLFPVRTGGWYHEPTLGHTMADMLETCSLTLQVPRAQGPAAPGTRWMWGQAGLCTHQDTSVLSLKWPLTWALRSWGCKGD